MTKAEQRALEAYPMKDYNKEPNYLHTCDSKMLDKVYREVFQLGYKQAERDLADAFQAEYAKELARAAGLAEFISIVKQMRHAQAEFRRTRIAGWDYAAQKLEAKIDKLIKQLEDGKESINTQV